MANVRSSSSRKTPRDNGEALRASKATAVPAGADQERLFIEYYSLYRIASTLTDQMDADHTIRETKKVVRETLRPNQFSLMLLDEETHELGIKSSFGFAARQIIQTKIPSENNIYSLSLRRRQPTYIADLQMAPKDVIAIPGGRHKKGAFLSVPLIVDGHRALGVLNLYRKEPHSFSNRDLELAAKIAGQTAQVLDKITLYHETRALSMTDELTGVFNRRYFNQRYEREFMRASRYQRPLTIMMVDIDHFKIFNDTNGHLLGDKVLKLVALTLENSLRKADLLARFGGEEFVIVLPEITKEKGRKVAEKLRRAIERAEFPKAKSQPLGCITVSVGLASFPEDSQEGNTLLAIADQGLYEAKARGRNQVAVAKMDADSSNRANKAVRVAFATPQ